MDDFNRMLVNLHNAAKCLDQAKQNAEDGKIDHYAYDGFNLSANLIEEYAGKIRSYISFLTSI